jgi:putative spermidine/putrescine transport system ATP-binding protein
MEEQPLVRLRNVSKSYDGAVPVIRGLSLDLAEGEVLTLLGPSGAGKTTTLMLLAGFETPDSGEIAIEGRSVVRLPAHRRGIGVVFQSFALFPHMTVAQNVAFPLRVRGLARDARERMVARALDMVRLTGLEDRLPTQLSGGQQQRVALARALVFEPRLVLLDEPLGSLDRQLREEMQMEIRNLHERLRVTMLHVTHDQSEALSLSDRIGVLAAGTLQQLGTPQELYDDPANALVARFLGESNRLPGRVEWREDDLAQVRLDCGLEAWARVADAGIGERCIISIRPERVAVAAVPASEMGEGALPATLQDIIFHGDHLRLRLLVGAPGARLDEVIVKRPAAAPLAGLSPGGQASVAWQPYHARAFRPEPRTNSS